MDSIPHSLMWNKALSLSLPFFLSFLHIFMRSIVIQVCVNLFSNNRTSEQMHYCITHLCRVTGYSVYSDFFRLVRALLALSQTIKVLNYLRNEDFGIAFHCLTLWLGNAVNNRPCGNFTVCWIFHVLSDLARLLAVDTPSETQTLHVTFAHVFVL